MKIILLILMALISFTSWSQNSFPPTGNAEINSGNLLIETSSWKSSLLTLKDTHYNPDQVYHFQLESDGLKIKQDNTINYNFSSGGNFLVRNGKVGIGTLSLDISGTGINNLVIGDGTSSRGLVVNASSSNDGILAFASDGVLVSRWIYNNPSGKLFYWKPSKGNLFTIDNSGKIGIGTDTPTSFLDIHTTGWNSATGIVLTQGSEAGNRSSGRIFLENEGEPSNSFAIMKSGDKLSFRANATANNSSGTEYMMMTNSGSVGIGTTTMGSHKLAVEGSIGAREIKVEASGWSDFVFEKDYELPTLEEVEQHINENGHLPEIPREEAVIENGINLGEMDAKLLQKIEELTLYLIEQNKELKFQQDQNRDQQKLIDQLQKEVLALKNE